MSCVNTGNWINMCEPLADAVVPQRFGFHEQVFSYQILDLKRLTIAVGPHGRDKTLISHCPFCGTNVETDYDYPAFIKQFGYARAREIIFSSRNLLIDNWYDETTKTFSEHRDKSNPNLINVPAISLAFAATVIKEAGGLEHARQIFKTAPRHAAVMIRAFWDGNPESHDSFYSMPDGVVHKALSNGHFEPIKQIFHSYEAMLESWRENYQKGLLKINKVLKIDLFDLEAALFIWEQENEENA
nr:hypothetical protein [Acinetobacter oleivorans]